MMVKDFYFPLLERLNSVGREYFARQKLLTGKQVFKIDGLECNRVELINGVLYLFVPEYYNYLNKIRRYKVNLLYSQPLINISDNLFRVSRMGT